MAEEAAAALRLLGLARRAGKLYIGSGSVMRALSRERPGIVFVARDAGKDIVRRVTRSQGESTLDHQTFESGDLASAFGREKLAVVSIHDTQFVAGIRKALSK